MRETKFRGKDLLKGDWRYGYLHLPNGGYNLMIQVNNYDSFGVIPETIGQYTGLRDKNGKEIYEGDIVKDIDGKVGYIAFLQQEMGFVIVWRNSDSRLGHRNRGGGYEFDNSIEVIGNIHDNPELIKEKSHE